MCSPKAFIKNDDKEVLVMEDIRSIVWETPNRFIMKDIIGTSKIVEGHIISMDLLNHHILLEGHVSE
jgi:predicted RNA-binding protein